MTAQSIVCGACAAEVPYGRLSCPSCGELLASVAGSRRDAASVATSVAARPAVPDVLHEPSAAPTSSIVDGQLSLDASAHEAAPPTAWVGSTTTQAAGGAVETTVAAGDSAEVGLLDDEADDLPAWTPPTSTAPWGTASDLNGGRTPSYMPRPVSGPRLRNPPCRRQPIRSRPMTSPHGCRTGPTQRSPTTMDPCSFPTPNLKPRRQLQQRCPDGRHRCRPRPRLTSLWRNRTSTSSSRQYRRTATGHSPRPRPDRAWPGLSQEQSRGPHASRWHGRSPLPPRRSLRRPRHRKAPCRQDRPSPPLSRRPNRQKPLPAPAHICRRRRWRSHPVLLLRLANGPARLPRSWESRLR
jgi:hypothetical protein